MVVGGLDGMRNILTRHAHTTLGIRLMALSLQRIHSRTALFTLQHGIHDR